MRILLFSDYPALFQALQQEAQRYSDLEIIQAHPDTEVLTLPDFQFMILAPLAASTEVGATNICATHLDAWQEKTTDLVELCGLRQAQLLLLSSDLIFKSDQQSISELDSPTNASALAKSLLKLEKKVAELPQSIILRTPPSISAAPESGLAHLVALCKAKKVPQEINYRGLQPLDDLARVLLGMLLQVAAGAKAWGLYHYAGSDAVSQSELFTALAQHLKIEHKDFVISSTNLPNMPSQHLLDTFGVHPRAWRDKLPELLEQLNESA